MLEEQVSGTAQEEPGLEDPTTPTELPDQGAEEGGEPEGVEKALKDTKAELTRVQQERAQERRDMAERLARLEGRLEGVQKPEPPAEDPFAFLDDPSYAEGFFDDPKKALDAHRKTVNVFGNALLARDRKIEELERKMQSIENRPDPSVMQKINELRKDPDYKGFTVDQLAVLVRKQQKPAPDKSSPGTIGGNRRVQSGPGSDPDVDKAVRSQYYHMYGPEAYEREFGQKWKGGA